jgi:hypothetical protein
MRQYTTKEQTRHLLSLDFPKPLGQFWIDKGYSISYSIGELIQYIEGNTDIEIRYDGTSHVWYIDYNCELLGVGENLIDALYYACVEFKKIKN